MKTSSGKVVATSFLYQALHRWIAGDVPVYLKFVFVSHDISMSRRTDRQTDRHTRLCVGDVNAQSDSGVDQRPDFIDADARLSVIDAMSSLDVVVHFQRTASELGVQ